MKCPACNKHELLDHAWLTTEGGNTYEDDDHYDCANCGPVQKEYVDAVAARLAERTEQKEAALRAYDKANTLSTEKGQQLAELREEMTTRRAHAVKQIEANDRLLIKLAELREAAQKTSDKAEDICNIYSELDLHVLDIDMVWELIHLCNNDSELAALLQEEGK